MTFRKSRKIESDDDEEQDIKQEDDYPMSDSSNDSIENEEELLKEEGAEFINDDESEESGEEIQYHRINRKINKKKRKSSSESEENVSDEDDLQDEIDELNGRAPNKKRRLLRESSDEENNYDEEVFPESTMNGPDLGSSEENEEEENMDDFIEDNRVRRKDTNEEDAPVFKSRQERDAMELFGCDTADLGNLDDNFDGYDEEEVDIDKAELFDPEDLERRFHTEKDEIIRRTDLPERFQLKSLQSEDITENDKSLKFEAAMVYNEFFKNRPGKMSSIINILVKVLHLIRNKCFEVPYIYIHEKDNLVNEEFELSIEDLWDIFDYHLKWKSIINRITRLMKLVDDLTQQNTSKLTQFFDESIARECIKSIRNLAEAQLVHDMINFSFETDNPSLKSSKSFRLEKNAKLDRLASLFGIEPQKFAVNLNERYTKYPVKNHDSLPEDVAKQYICSQFSTVDKVLQVSRAILGHLISKEIYIVRFVEEFFQNRAKMRIVPTPTGYSTIDSKHDMYNYKYVTDKPIADFDNNYDFLIINQAERDKLITVDISLVANDRDELLNKLYEYSSSDECNALARAWNDQRRLVLTEIIDKTLLPATIKKYRKNIIEVSQKRLSNEIAKKLHDQINVRSFGNEIKIADAKMMGISYETGTENKKVAMTIIDENGTIVQSHCFFELVRQPKSDKDRELKRQELKKMMEFIQLYKVQGIAITGHCRLAQRLQFDLEKAMENADREHDVPNLNVFIMDPKFAEVYGNSKVATELHPQLIPLVKQSLGVALNRLDPLLGFCQLMNFDLEIKKVPMHHHISLVNENLLMTLYERKFIEVVSYVGVDINNCLQIPQLVYELQFVPGLGIRKARNLISQIIENCRNQQDEYDDYYSENFSAFISNRTQLMSEGYVGLKVAANCASFLKIVGYSQKEGGHILDETRINPMNYECAHKIANDALDLNYPVTNQKALRKIIEDPSQLNYLDLDAFVKSIFEANQTKAHFLIGKIARELQNPFEDNRPKFFTLTNSDLFYLFINETKDTFDVGTIAEFTVESVANRKPSQKDFDEATPKRNVKTGYFVCPLCNEDYFAELNDVWHHFDKKCLGRVVGVNLRNENGVSAFLSIKNIADKFVKNIYDHLKIKQLVVGCIMKIDHSRIKVDISLKESDLHSAIDKRNQQRDVFYDENQETQLKTQKEKKLSNHKNVQIIRRMTDHPYFKNINYFQFEKAAAKYKNGDFVIRPSSKGKNHLTISWKIGENLFKHIGIVEEQKENEYTIGKVLIVESERYEDLDEVIATFLQPMITYTDEIFSNKNFKNIKAEDTQKIEQLIIEEKRKNPTRIPYFIVPFHTFPGRFGLVFMPNKSMCCDSFVVTKNGFEYRKNVFRTINSLLANFKEIVSNPATANKKRPFQENTNEMNNYKIRRY